MLSAGLPLAGGNYHHRNTLNQLFHTLKPITLTSFTVRSSSSSLTEPVTSSSKVEDDQKLSLKVGGTVSFPPLKVSKRVVLVRPGQSTWNAEGSSDFSILTNKGEAQAETSRQMLIDDSFDICFSRPITVTSFTLRSSSTSNLKELNTLSSSKKDDDCKVRGEVGGAVKLPGVKVAKRDVLMRHGQSTWNAEGRIQGSSNFSTLTNKGEAQAL